MTAVAVDIHRFGVFNGFNVNIMNSTDENSLLNGDVLSQEFHGLFKSNLDLSRKKNKKRKQRKKIKQIKGKEKSKAKIDSTTESVVVLPPTIEVCANPSSFAVFAGVRQSVLEKHIRDAAQVFLVTNTSQLSDSEHEDDEEEKVKDVLQRIPKIVGIGLCSVFELIKESWVSYPSLCTLALEALLDILQGQQPEGLKSEPVDVIDSLFSLLLELASQVSSENKKNAATVGLTSVACSCLLSLVVARGETGKLLSAVAALLMSDRCLATEDIKMPYVLTSLQRSVHAVLLGKTVIPDWISNGILKKGLIDSFHLNLPEGKGEISHCSLASDGQYLYFHTFHGNLYKAGTGYGRSVRGHLYAQRSDFYPRDKGWLGFAEGRLFYKSSASTNMLTVLDCESLKEVETFFLDGKDFGPSVFFCDGDNIGTITSAKDDSFVVRTYSSSYNQMPCTSELPLKLARKCLDLFGWAVFDEEMGIHTITTTFDDEPTVIAAGKEFALMRTISGKILYTGKAPSLGIKQGGAAVSRWVELPITKSPKIVQFSVGHEGLHALLIAEDGGVFFVGLARRGEDGDQSKGRRQPKPVKPKKMIKVESLNVIYSACNNGTSALITKDGELYMFGKDTTHCHHATGLVTDLKDVPLIQVALGKAHVVALSNKGQVYTFGINNKGQCGREFASHAKDAIMTVAMATANEEEGDDEELETEEPEVMCPAGQHKWRQDECMVCTVCGECTGFGVSCISKGQPDRNPGLPCGCGWGDSGCSECGCCKTCAGENKVVDSILAAELDVIMRRKSGNRLPDHIQRKLDERRHRHKPKTNKSSKSNVKNIRTHVIEAPPEKGMIPSLVEDVVSSDPERETSKISSLAPARLLLPSDCPVSSVACGLHHTVLLLQNGEVFTFGSNQHGQLGVGDLTPRGAPVHVRMPSPVTHIAAGSNHTVALTVTALIYTFGSYQKGQLGRLPPQPHGEEGKKEKSSREAPWFSVPGAVPNIGPKFGRRPTWVGASGDQTFLKIDESLINAHTLTHSMVVANKNCICLIPTVTSSFKCLLINKADGSCRSFSDNEQVDLSNHSICIDPAYNVMWSFSFVNSQMNCYNAVAAETINPSPVVQFHTGLKLCYKPGIPSNVNSEISAVPPVLTSTLATPIYPHYKIPRSQAALHLLSCMDTLAMAQELNWRVHEDEIDHQSVSKVYNKEDFAAVNRFESHGGGWGYSGHSIEAIRFMADTDILLGGFGLFGGRGEYTGKIKLFDIGIEGGDQEIDGELLAETEEVPYECGARQKYPMLFDEPIPLQANRWYVAWSRVSGPSSDCGSSGQCVVTTEDQVAFYFKSSKKSNNGTDVNAGQIPQLLYKVITHESHTTNCRSDVCEPVYVLSREFPRMVTPDCLHSLLRLLEWSWQTFKTTLLTLCPGQKLDALHLTLLLELEKLVYVSCSSMRLLRTYINEVYPNSVLSKKTTVELPKLVECVADTRSLLRRILSDSLTFVAPVKHSNNHVHKHSKNTYQEANVIATMAVTILEECHTTFVACFHAFYPTSFLKWACLCDLLQVMESDPTVADSCDHLLAAILASLCSPTVKLTSILPIIYEQEDLSPRKQNSVPSSSSEISIASSTECKYPVLVEHMLHKTQLEEGCRTSYTFHDVLNRLLTTVVRPVQLALGFEKTAPSSKLVSNTCGLLAAIIAELAAQTTGLDADLHSSGGRVLHITSSRFTRVSQSRTWNTGNGSPDAICFSVDRPGIVIAGVTLYGGVGTYDYELELLDDQNSNSSDPSHTQRWNSLEIIRGTFGPDDCVGDVVEVKFDHPVAIKEGIKYAIRLRSHGGRTSNGDGGLSIVKGPDGTTFTYSTCSLSFNGTNHTRGQLPQILYFSTPQDSDSQQSNRAIIELQARKSALSITSDIVKVVTTLLQQARDEADGKIMDVLASAHVISMLLPMILAHIAPIATSDPRSAVQVLEMIQDVLPPVSHLNNRFHSLKAPLLVSVNDTVSHDLCTTSNHYAIVESDHPYKPATVATFKVRFPESVKWMSLEFDSQCGTAQSEDALQLYIPSQESPFRILTSAKFQDEDGGCIESPYWPVLHKFSGINSWPRFSVILPGNEVLFSLETASDYVKDDKACFYGFKCLVVGYDWISASEEGLHHLEEELAYLGGMCAASLMKRELLLPPVSIDEMEEDLDVVDDIANQVHNAHPNLLGKGFAISHPPSVHQALEGVLPFSYLSNERSFLRDFVLCAPGTSGGRLARWLQPDSYVDLKHCEVLYSKDEMKCGWPTVVTIVTKDQYEEIVNVPNLKLEVKAVPVDKRDHGVEDSNRKVPRMSKPDSLTFGGNPLPNIAVPYEVTVKDKMCYYAISMMKAYENYSFEELRYTTPALKRPSENMMVRANNDGTYSCNWTPGSVGWYLVHVCIDGFEIENSRKVEVKEPPQGVVPPSQNLVKKNIHQPNKARRFVAKYSAGLRIRAHPSLQSEQIGIVHVNGVVTFIDELHNDDGVWVRLSLDTIKKYCQNGYPEAWCLQYNQHLGRTLLVPLEEPKTFMEESHKDNSTRRVSETNSKNNRKHRTGGPGIYHVVKCGASGHNIRSTPSLKAPPVGMLVLGNQLTVVEEIVNLEGSWIKLDKDSMRRFCFNTDGEAWSLALNKNDIVYLQHENDIVNQYGDPEPINRPLDNGSSSFDGTDGVIGGSTGHFWDSAATASVNVVKPFDFSTAIQNPVLPAFGTNDSQGVFTFGPSGCEIEGKVSFPDDVKVTTSFNFGFSNGRYTSHGSQSSSTHVVLPKPVVPERRPAPNPSPKPSSVLQKWLRNDENRADQQHSTRESNIPPELIGVSVKELVKVLGESRVNGNEATPPHTPPSTPPRRLSRCSSPKPLISGTHRDSSPIAIPGAKASADSANSSPGSVRSFQASQLGCSSASSVSRPPRRGSTQSDSSHGSPTPTSQAINTVPLRRATTTIEIFDSSSKSFAQTGTQTSPDGSKGHFSIGTGSKREESVRLSPKLSRKDRAVRQLRSKRERAQSPAPNQREHSNKEYQSVDPVKTAMSPLVAECLRAVFAAFLWHEGIVHDAMACASFLKFHPDLPKHLPKVPRPELPLDRPELLSKEQKARLRHSVEVSASNFLNIQPSTAEAFARSLANANVNKNTIPKPSETIKEETIATSASDNRLPSDNARKVKLDDKIISSPVASGPATAVQSPIGFSGSWIVERKVEGDLPPSLQHLLVLWEILTAEILKMMTQHLSLPVTTIHSRLAKNNDVKDKDVDRKVRKKKEWRLSTVGRGNLFGEAAGGPFGGPERETMCELCGKFFPHPVTYHMRQAHPGCGGHAGGKGYNSGGNFCGGWAGNCGDGGVGGSSWYLICDRCREKYLRQKRQVILKEKSRKNRKKMLPGKLLSPLPAMETHQIMKQNAAFLLDLASASGAGMTSHSLANSRRSPHSGANSLASNMPSLNEYSPLEPTPFPLESFQCLQMLGVQQMDSNLLSENFLLEESLWQSRELGASSRVRSAEDGGVVTLHSLTEVDDIGTASGFGSDLLTSNETENPRGRIFHRSISVGTTTREWNREEGEGRIIMTRKRNKSSGEGVEDGSSLLCHPSSTLTKLVSLATDKSNPGEILGRPVLAFILQRHDLQSLRLAMKQAVRKAACRAYAIQGLNWLIRSVTQPTALHDLLWFFVAALTPLPDLPEENEDEEGVGNKKERPEQEHQQEKDVAICDHPLSDITIAGETVRPLVTAFHTLLQSISDLMMMLPMGSALQQMAMRCWCLKFRQSDHVFLHKSHVFSNISKILSRSEEELCGDGDGMSSLGDSFQSSSVVECYKDLTPTIDLKASSRPGMLGSLIDNSTETFWESGDEDRNKTKALTMTCSASTMPKMVYVHIDNCRDLGNKVSSIAFKVGVHVDEFIKLRQLEVESRYTGWVSCPITEGRPSVIRLELKGPDNTLRIRQVKLLGEINGESLQVGKGNSAFVVQQRNCEAETLKVFRLLTSQVFGKLISNEETEKGEKGVDVDCQESHLQDDKIEGNNDLKEHMVGILFSRSKLTHLQKQVCAHIVQAIRKEAARVRDEWEALLCSKSLSMEELPKSSDAYCFEMLSMVLALSGSSVGRAYLAQQCSLLMDLLSLLHTGSARVQRQVTSLLRRVLPEVSPQTFAQILGVKALPPTDYSIVSEVIKTPEAQEPHFDIHRMGILDVFFSCIAKALTVQMKVKGKETNKGITTVTLATSIHPRDFMGARWWLRGCITRKLAEVIINLLQDMAAGKLSDSWASITKGAVAENILNLTKLEERCRTPSDCLKTPTLWLALSSLCVLDQDHVERLSSGQWAGTGDGQQSTSRPTCDNHDDGETLAIILCSTCGNLCADCDRYLHLHRRTHSHQRQVFKEEEEAIKVDLHEGCGRTKLFWIMALADSKTLKAMVEFREGAKGKSTTSSAGTCRFCGTVGETGLLAIGNVCGDAECQEHARSACIKSFSCGHMCGGIRNEVTCLPCLHGCSNDPSLKQDADDMCMICFTEALSCAPAVQLFCGHIFHLHCCHNVLTKRWAGPRITFSFSLCPICKATIDHPILKELLTPVRTLYEDVRRKALMRLEYEGLHKAEAITSPGARFYADPASYAMERYAYYVCYKCNKAYFGGEARCDIEGGGGDDYDPTELVCGACSDVSRAQMCPKHGTDFLEYKCRYCCSVAVFFCFGTTHFCNACHDDFQHVTNIPKHELPHCPAGPKGKQLEGDECPLHIQHPPTGKEFALGCGVCRNAHTF